MENAFAGSGFSKEAPLYVFPMEMFLPGSDLTPIERNIDKIIEGLTRWEPKLKGGKTTKPEKIIIEGEDHQQAVATMNFLFLRNLWGDGLPILPPTEERVKWLLMGTDLPPETVVGKILPKGGIATVETLAIAAAMAGARPEYMPVIMASIEAIIDPGGLHEKWNATTGDPYPVVIVNGPIAKQIRLNSGYGCLGPSSEYPAGATIGRSLRFLLMNVGGAIPGVGTMSIYGGAARYTNVVFAEDEDGLPPDWRPLNVERGFPAGTNTVTVHPIGVAGTLYAATTSTKEEAQMTMRNWAAHLGIPAYSYWSHTFHPDGAPAIVLMSRGTAQGLSNLGWSKEDVQAFLWENSKVPESALLKRWLETSVREGKVPRESVQYPMPIAPSPRNIMIVVAGGESGNHAYFMEVSFSGKVASKEIKLPGNWEELLKKAEEDLGPIPVPRAKSNNQGLGLGLG